MLLKIMEGIGEDDFKLIAYDDSGNYLGTILVEKMNIDGSFEYRQLDGEIDKEELEIAFSLMIEKFIEEEIK